MSAAVDRALLERGRRALEVVCLRLLGWGLVIESPELHSLDENVGRSAINAPDVLVWNKNYPYPNNLIVEVKTTTRPFSDVSSWPFPDCIVNRVDTWIRKERKPFATVTMSKVTEKLVVLPTTFLEGELDIVARVDGVDRVEREYFVAPRSLLQPIEWLREALRPINH